MRRPSPELLRACALGAAMWACTPQHTALPAGDDPVLARAREVGAAERAPDLWLRAEEAAARARRSHEAGDGAAALDQRSEARLWREAAIAEAERLAAEEANALLDQQVHARAQEVAAASAEREAEYARAQRLAAGLVALEEAQRMLAIAAEDKRRRPRLGEAELRQGARALLERAQLVAAAAEALGATAENLKPVNARIESARTALTRRPAEALHEADLALFAAHAALGPLREGLTEDAARQSLQEALHEAGFSAARTERGLAASVPLSGGGQARMLARLCTLRTAFPSGGLQVVLRGGSKAQLGVLRRQLEIAGCDGEHLQWQHLAHASDSAVEAVWTGY